MSPDWSAKPEAVPYTSLDNPQSLNLYGYVGNNPLGRRDADGHEPTTFSLIMAGATLGGVANHLLLSHARSELYKADQELINTDSALLSNPRGYSAEAIGQMAAEIPRLQEDQRRQAVSIGGDIYSIFLGGVSLAGKMRNVKLLPTTGTQMQRVPQLLRRDPKPQPAPAPPKPAPPKPDLPTPPPPP